MHAVGEAPVGSRLRRPQLYVQSVGRLPGRAAIAAMTVIAIGAAGGAIGLLIPSFTVPLDAFVEESCEFPSDYRPRPGDVDLSRCVSRTTRVVPASTYSCMPARHLLAGNTFDAEGADQGKCRMEARRRAGVGAALVAMSALLLSLLGVAGAIAVARRAVGRQGAAEPTA